MWNGIVAMALPKQEGKKLFQLVCGNAITEIEGKKKCGNEFVAMASPKQDEKKIVAIGLWQWHCRNRGDI